MVVRLKILCWACADKANEEEEPEVITRAWRREVEPIDNDDPDDYNMLVCPPWGLHDVTKRGRKGDCDGCGRKVAIAESSDWLLEKAGRL